MTAVGRPDELVGRTGATGVATGWAGRSGDEGSQVGRVALRNLSCRFGNVQALDGFSLEIGPGEFVALLGPSGYDEAAALRILAGFENATSGKVLVDGQDVQAMPPQRRGWEWCSRATACSPT